MDLNTIENLNIKYVLDRGTGTIIYQNDSTILVHDEVSKALMLASDDVEEGIEILDKNITSKDLLLMVSNVELGGIAFKKYGFEEKMECFQVVYNGEGISEHKGGLSFREATLDDLPFISAEYDLISEEELKEVISRHNIILGYTDEGIVGFIGEHLEGSIGLLYILPQYRRRGYASELEKEKIRRTLAKGFIPFGQVVTSNDASMRLQESLGLTRSDGTILWMWKA